MMIPSRFRLWISTRALSQCFFIFYLVSATTSDSRYFAKCQRSLQTCAQQNSCTFFKANTNIFQNQRGLALRLFFSGEDGKSGFTAAFGLIRAFLDSIWTHAIWQKPGIANQELPGELQTAALQLALWNKIVMTKSHVKKCNANRSKSLIDKWLKWYLQIFVEL